MLNILLSLLKHGFLSLAFSVFFVPQAGAIDAASTLPPGYSIPFPKSKLNILLFGNGICCLLASAYALAVYTIYKNPFCKWYKLWGIDGELWDPKGRLPNYSYAGYFKVRH